MSARLTLETAPSVKVRANSQAASGLTWRRLAVLAGVGDLAMLVWLSVAAQDRFALGLMVPILIGVGLSRFRGGAIGRVVLGLSLADMTWYTVSGAVWNAVSGEGPAAVFVPAWLGACSVVGLVAVIASLVRRRLEPGTSSVGPMVVAAMAAAGLVLTLVASAVLAVPRVSKAPTAALGITSENMAFSTRSLSADAGDVTVRLTNRDLSWHTFTVDSLAVDLKVPVGADGSVTFQAAPGTYEFYCSIPGHAAIGMRGTLTVR